MFIGNCILFGYLFKFGQYFVKFGWNFYFDMGKGQSFLVLCGDKFFRKVSNLYGFLKCYFIFQVCGKVISLGVMCLIVL